MIVNTFVLSRATNLSPEMLNSIALKVTATHPTAKMTTRYTTSMFIRSG